MLTLLSNFFISSKSRNTIFSNQSEMRNMLLRQHCEQAQAVCLFFPGKSIPGNIVDVDKRI